MAVTKYIPKTSTVIDRRSKDGGYYHANCEECGREFYPKRSNAKYCGRACSVRVNRRRVTLKREQKKVVVPEKVVSVSKEPVFASKEVFNSMRELLNYLKGDYNKVLRGNTVRLKSELKKLKTGKDLDIGPVTIRKISARKFAI